MTAVLTFTVPGQPETKGSLSCVCIQGRGRLLEGKTSAGRKRQKEWRQAVTAAAQEARLSVPECPWTAAVVVDLVFYLTRPARPTDPLWPSSRGSRDSDKLARLACDAMQDAGVYDDDSRVVDLRVRKVYGDRPGLTVRVGQAVRETVLEGVG